MWQTGDGRTVPHSAAVLRAAAVTNFDGSHRKRQVGIFSSFFLGSFRAVAVRSQFDHLMQLAQGVIGCIEHAGNATPRPRPCRPSVAVDFCIRSLQHSSCADGGLRPLLRRQALM